MFGNMENKKRMKELFEWQKVALGLPLDMIPGPREAKKPGHKRRVISRVVLSVLVRSHSLSIVKRFACSD
jgi:hypothetical protein